MGEPPATPYRAPGWVTRHLLNGSVMAVTRLGWGVWGSRVLEIPGRRSGLPRRVPVNLLAWDDGWYLVAPRGETEWVKNLRANDGRLALLRGRQRVEYEATELPDGEKVPVLRAYLRRWRMEVGVFFEGVGPKAPDDELAVIAHRHPVFRLQPLQGG